MFIKYLGYITLDEKLVWILQPGGDGQGLTVFLENSVSAKDVWTLKDSWSDQTGWIDGRVEIKASELAGDTIFRVNKTRYLLPQSLWTLLSINI